MFWPSAYGGGYPLRAYSSLYGYRIVPAGWGDVRDITGEVVDGLERHCNGTQAAHGTSDCGYGRSGMSKLHPSYSNFCDACVFVATLDLVNTTRDPLCNHAILHNHFHSADSRTTIP